MFSKLQARADSEQGFTLIELLVVILIIGILAAIAVPAFLSQRDKASDSNAKVNVRTAQTAMETCATDNSGQYGTCNVGALHTIEPQVSAASVAEPVPPGDDTYTLRSTSTSGHTFTIDRDNQGAITRSCTGGGGCNNQTW